MILGATVSRFSKVRSSKQCFFGNFTYRICLGTIYSKISRLLVIVMFLWSRAIYCYRDSSCWFMITIGRVHCSWIQIHSNMGPTKKNYYLTIIELSMRNTFRLFYSHFGDLKKMNTRLTVLHSEKRNNLADSNSTSRTNFKSSHLKCALTYWFAYFGSNTGVNKRN